MNISDNPKIRESCKTWNHDVPFRFGGDIQVLASNYIYCNLSWPPKKNSCDGGATDIWSLIPGSCIGGMTSEDAKTHGSWAKPQSESAGFVEPNVGRVGIITCRVGRVLKASQNDILSLKLTAISPLKKGRDPKGKERIVLPTTHFQG